jgi:hypothetical protein
MDKPLRFPSLRTIIGSTVVLILALGLTQLSFFFQDYEQLYLGNNCGPQQDQPCIVSAKDAGFPVHYMADQLGTSAMGVLGLEDFLIVPFLLDLLLYALVVGGMWFLVGRKYFWSFWVPIVVATGALVGFVLNSLAVDPVVGTSAVIGGMIVGVFGALLAIFGTLVLWNDMGLPFARTLLKFLTMLALPGLVCGLFAGGLFGAILQLK